MGSITHGFVNRKPKMWQHVAAQVVCGNCATVCAGARGMHAVIVRIDTQAMAAIHGAYSLS